MTKTLDTEIELLKQSHNVMQQDLKEIKEEQRAWHKELKDLINGLWDKFATKAEHKENSEKIALISKVLSLIWSTFILAIIGAILNSILK